MATRPSTVKGTDGKPRCGWASADPLYEKYHDSEWGRPLKDDHALFELLTLEGCQAGLSWITVLRKRENYRKAYDGFDPKKIAKYTPAKLAKLLADPGIIRHRGKIVEDGNRHSSSRSVACRLLPGIGRYCSRLLV